MYILYYVDKKQTIVEGLVPLMAYEIFVIAVYKDSIERRGHIQYTHTGMSSLNLNQGL